MSNEDLGKDNCSRRPITFREFSQVASLDVVVSFEENLSQTGFANWVILQVEFVEPMEGILMSMHVQCVDRQVVGCQLQRFEHLRECELVPISEDDDVLKVYDQAHKDDAR